MERELFAFLNFNLSCDHNELDSFVNDRQLEWEAMKTAAKSAHHPYLCYPRELLISQRKRRTSDSNSREHALRHKRASDAAVALLRSSQHKTTLSHSDLQKATQAPTRSSYSCRSTPPISYSASLSPSEASTSYSPLSIHHTVSPEMSDVCDSSPQQSASKPSRAIH